MANLINPRLYLALGLILSPLNPAPSATTTQGVAELEGYKHRLENLQSGSDPARAAQLKQMQRLLSLMQKSIIIEDEKTQASTAAVIPPPTTPLEPTTEVLPKATVEEPALAPVVPAPPPTTTPLPTKQSDPPPSSPPRPTLPAPPPAEIPDWFFRVQLTAAVGYQDNLLRSAFSNLDSALFRGELDLQLLNTHREDDRVMMLGRYTRTHFLSEPSVRDEDLVFMLGQYDHRITEDHWLGVTTSYFSAHQPFDDPEFADLDGASAPLTFRQLSLAPQFTWEPNDQHALVFSGGYRREETEGLDIESQDNDQWFLSLGYTFEPSDAHRLRLSYQYSNANYDERRARQASGEFLPHELELNTHEWEATYRRSWKGEAFRWQTEARLRLVMDEDAQGGYDDAIRVEARGRIRLRHEKRTEIRGELRYGQYFYESRQISLTDPGRRDRSYWAGALTLEHPINRSTSFWLSYDFRENSGNKVVDRYGVQTLYTGIRFTF